MRLNGQGDGRLPGALVGDRPDGVDGFPRAAPDHRDAPAGPGGIGETAQDLGRDFFGGGEFVLPFLSPGAITPTPHFWRRARFSVTAGLRPMWACIAGATRTGTPPPRATEAKVVTGVSSMPWAIFPRVLAVAGAMR